MVVQINQKDIELNNKEVKLAREMITTFLKNAKENCEKIGSFSMYFTLLVVAHTVTGNLINTYDEDKIQMIMDKLSKTKKKD